MEDDEDDDDSYYYPQQDALRDSVIEANRPSYVLCGAIVLLSSTLCLMILCVDSLRAFRLTAFGLQISELEE